jgi:hypothetical protein
MSAKVPFAANLVPPPPLGDSPPQAPFVANVIPPSPEAAALAAYADVPVSLYTGIPEITIPLYALKERDLNVPITLNYHASAHKVEDQASRVGLGWSVNAGGMVTRSIRGLPDEYPGGFLHQAVEMREILVPDHHDHKLDAYDAGSKEQRFGWYDLMARGCRSAEPDIYYFNFGGYTGRFQFDWDGSICIASEAKLQITPIGLDPNSGNFIQGWKIVTPDGIQWTFDVEENTTAQFRGGDTFSCRAVLEHAGPPQTWHLAETFSPFTNSRVRFEYTDYSQTLKRRSLETKVHGKFLGAVDFNQFHEILTSDVHGWHLRTISTSSGDTRIEFIPGLKRTDVTGTFGLNSLALLWQNVS